MKFNMSRMRLKPITKVTSRQDKKLQELEVESTKGGELNRITEVSYESPSWHIFHPQVHENK
jgi:hypothetical protein